jgi:hypothetical protein
MVVDGHEHAVAVLAPQELNEHAVDRPTVQLP